MNNTNDRSNNPSTRRLGDVGQPGGSRPRTAPTGFALIIGFLAIVIASCGSASEPVSNAASSGSTFNPVAGEWEAQTLSIEGDMEIDIESEATPPSMSIQGNTITGFTSCNDFAGTVEYDIAGDRFSATIDSVGDNDCGNQTEQFFLQALESATTFQNEDFETLRLSDNAEYPNELSFTVVLQP